MNSIQNNSIHFQSAKITKKPKTDKKQEKKDIFLDTPLRNLGFLDEIGAAFRPVLSGAKNPVIKNLPNFAIIPASLYVTADVIDKYNKGEDGTGKKKSIKMAAREGAYQGITSILAPIGIVSGLNKILTKNTPKVIKSLQNTKIADKLTSTKAGKAGKLAGAVISLFALSKLAKPVDTITRKLFENVVDPMLGIKKDKAE